MFIIIIFLSHCGKPLKEWCGLKIKVCTLYIHIYIYIYTGAVSLLFSPPWLNSPTVWCTRNASYIHVHILVSAMSCIYSNNVNQTSMYNIEYYCSYCTFWCSLKTAWQYFENYPDDINSGTTSDWSMYCYEIKLYSTCLYDQWSRK